MKQAALRSDRAAPRRSPGMARRLRGHSREPAPVINMTPMIDIVFLLLIFFMLVDQVSLQRAIKLNLPDFAPSAARLLVDDGAIALSVAPAAERLQQEAVFYLGGLAFTDAAADLEHLVQALRFALEQRPALEVVIRAAEGEEFELVYQAMQLARDAGADQVQLATLVSEQGK